MRFRVFCLLAALTALAVGPAAAQSSYSQWQNPDQAGAAEASAKAADQKLQDFVNKLNGLVDKAEKARAADPAFLRDLRDLARGFDRPWQVRIFTDAFTDGDFTANPTWTVGSGKYWVEKGWGLRSSLEIAAKPAAGNASNQKLSNEQKAAAIFGQILNQALGSKKGGTGGPASTAPPAAADAVIHSALTITNAFSLEMAFSSWIAKGRLDVAVYQGQFASAATSPGYRLAYTPGGALQILRVSSRGTAVIDSSTGSLNLEDKKVHQLVWSRHADGRMAVTLDGQAVLETADRGFRDKFNGLALINLGGDFIIKSIAVDGAS